MNYYNDNDPRCAAWLRELIAGGLIAKGDVDERDIREIEPADLKGYHQVHLFAGIGGWPYALRLAGWPDDRPVWTGSCPCQPFSVAGKGEGTDDPRHLWPAFRWLLAQRRVPMVFGEQVASAAGRGWLAGVRSDLEGMGYRFGAADLCAASVGAPHARQRLWWVADTDEAGRKDYEGRTGSTEQDRGQIAGANDARPGTSQWLSEPDVVRVVDGVSREVGAAVGAFGNSIVPQVAAEFISACAEL